MEFMENNENQRQKAAASRFSIVQGDITTLAVDAIANAANTSLLAEAEWTERSTGRQGRSFWKSVAHFTAVRPGKQRSQELMSFPAAM